MNFHPTIQKSKILLLWALFVRSIKVWAKKKKKKKKNGQNRVKQDLPFGLFVTSHIELHMIDEVYVYIFSAPTQ